MIAVDGFDETVGSVWQIAGQLCSTGERSCAGGAKKFRRSVRGQALSEVRSCGWDTYRLAVSWLSMTGGGDGEAGANLAVS